MRTALDLLGAFLSSPGTLHPLTYSEAYLSAIIAYIKREPVRTAALILALIVIGASVVLGVPVSAVIAEVVSAIAVLEKVRDAVTPVITEVLDDVQAVEAAPSETPADPAS